MSPKILSLHIILASLAFTSRLQGTLARYEHEQGESFVGTARDSNLDWVEASWASIQPAKELVWAKCYNETLECSRLQVPLNYSDPEGQSAAIALARIKANVSSDSPDYLGPILFNPGGPGGSGVDLILSRGQSLATVVGPQFDIVGFDPRGVARSTPKVSWFKTRVEREVWSRPIARELNHSSDNVASHWARDKIDGRLAGERLADVLPHIQTDHTARDMLRITEAYGKEKIQYWGFSYGTVLGSTFAAMFPDKVHRIVIDGVVDVENDYYSTRWTENLLDTDDTLNWFFKDCFNAGPELCSFYESSPEAIGERLNRLYNSIIQTPVAVHTEQFYGIVDYARLRQTILPNLYSPFAAWKTLANGLADLEAGNGTVLYQMLEVPPFECTCDPLEHAFDSVPDAQTAILCNDGDIVPSSLEDAEQHYQDVLKVSEWGSIWAGFRMACSSWPRIPKSFFRGPISGNTSHPILLIGNTADPVAPLHAARVVSEGFPGSVVLTQDCAGHCSIAAPSICTARAVRSYFVNGTLPEPGTVCPIIGTPFKDPTSESDLKKRRLFEGELAQGDAELLEALRHLGGLSGGRPGLSPFHL
ncbi:hypothetical protein VNI00_006079 [Paramarasmius palmivorus]|uniref:Alpha/beta-hydrolase n=1 Tax=Paramarasmius palmivorus TaxID=297713 RepID=A0AAW0D5I6_9AGAR